jgi:hypothetical protein
VGANSWGPDNAYAFIKKHGHFNSTMMVLVFSSHDLYDRMHHQEIVGVHPAWPSKQPALALTDGFFKYVLPKIKNKVSPGFHEYSYLGITKEKGFNPGWKNLVNYCHAHHIELLVYLHAEQNEARAGAYNENGKVLIDLLKSENVTLVKGIDFIKDNSYYRDFIHLNNKGQRKLSLILFPYLVNHTLKQNKSGNVSISAES